MKLRVLDLFSGIGGFSLGLERTGGFETVAFCEIEPYCRRVLAKHWPDVPCYDDVRTLTADALRRDGIAVDVICGGFPCQDISFAGKRVGLEGARSGLWREYARLIGELRPRFVIVENVPGLLNLGMGAVLGELSALRYDAVWDCIPASAVGAPHRRDRVWIVAYTDSPAIRQQQKRQRRPARRAVAGADSASPNADGESKHAFAVDAEMASTSESMANANNGNQNGRSGAVQMGRQRRPRKVAHARNARGTEWLSEPAVGRLAHGVSNRVDQLRGLGNAVVPQIPELIGRAILKAEGLAA